MLTALFWLVSAKLRHQARKDDVIYRYLFMHPSGDDLTLLAQLVNEGAVEVITDRVFPFDRIADAFAYSRTGPGQRESRRPDGVTLRRGET